MQSIIRVQFSCEKQKVKNGRFSAAATAAAAVQQYSRGKSHIIVCVCKNCTIVVVVVQKKCGRFL